MAASQMAEQPWNQSAGDTENQRSLAMANGQGSSCSTSKQTSQGKGKKPTKAKPKQPETPPDQQLTTLTTNTRLDLLISFTILHLPVIKVFTGQCYDQNSTCQSFNSNFQSDFCTSTQKYYLKPLHIYSNSRRTDHSIFKM